MRSIKYAYAAGALAAVLAATIGWIAWHKTGDGQTGTIFPTGAAVDPSAADAKLLQDVLDIEASRTAGDINFSYVPKDRPPDLLRMTIGSDSGTITDTYQFGSRKLGALAAFTSKPTDLCTNIKSGQVPGVCVRDSTLTPRPANPAFTHLAVYFSANVNAQPDDNTTAKAKQFWANVSFVPLDQATWFADLRTRAQQTTPK